MSGRNTSGKARRWRRRMIVAMVIGPILLLVGTNLLLGSSWGRKRVAHRMTELTGFHWAIGEASWSPWGGVRVGELEARAPIASGEDPGPVLLVAEVRVRPYWLRLLRGKLELRELLVERPVGEVPVELLAAMMPAQRPLKVQGGSRVSPPRGPMPGTKPPAPVEESGSEGKPEGQAPAAPKAPARVEEEKKPSKARLSEGLPGRLRVRNGQLRIYSLKAPGFGLQFSGLEADIPVGGPEERGSVEVERVAWGKNELLSGLRSELSWKRPFLIVEKSRWDWEGVPLEVQARVQLEGRMRMALEVITPSGGLDSVEVAGFPGATVSAGQVEMLARLQGELLQPASWEGTLLAGGRGLSVANGEQPLLAFEAGRVLVDFRGGLLQVPDLRLVGETFSILGNGAVRWDGQVLAVLRLVADWEYAAALSRAAAGVGFNRGTLPWLQPLETPDRFYRDLHFEGAVSEALVDVGRNGEEMKVGVAMDRVTRFAQGEKWEDDHGKEHDPRWDSLLLQQ